MATVKDLGQKVKQKYPGIYDQLSDEEVGTRVKQKYPEAYGQFTDITPSKPSQSTPIQASKKKGFLDKFADVSGKTLEFLGEATIKPVGRALTTPFVTAASAFRSPENMNKPVNTPFGAVKPYNAMSTGELVKEGLNVASIIPAGKAVSAIKGAKPLTKLGIIGQGAKYGAAYGAGYGFAEGIDKPEETAGGLVGDTLAGAAGGGLLGAAFGALPAGMMLFKETQKKLNPTIVEAFVRGVGPTGQKAAEFSKTAKTVMPDLLQTSQQMGVDIAKSEKPVEALIDVTKTAKKNIWSQFKGLIKGRGNAQFDGNKIADAMIGSMDARFIQQEPAAAAKITEKANQYRRMMTVDEAESFLESANGELYSYYAKNKVKRDVAMKDPSVSYVVKEAEMLRNSLYSKINELTGMGAEAKLLKQRYGALSETQDKLIYRQAQLNREKPFSLQEQISIPWAMVKGVGSALRGDVLGAAENFGVATASKAIKEAQSSENMIRKAFEKAYKQGLSAYPGVKPPAPMTTNLLAPPLSAAEKIKTGGVNTLPFTSSPVLTTPPTTFESPAQIIGRQSPPKIPQQLLLGEGKPGASGPTINLPQSAREQNLGLDEVRNTVFGKKETPMTISANKKVSQSNAEKLRSEVLSGKRESLRLNNASNINRFDDIFGKNAKPEDAITVFRAGSSDIKPGDYVTTDSKKASQYLKERPGSKVYKKTIKIKDLVPGGGLRIEFFFSPN